MEIFSSKLYKLLEYPFLLAYPKKFVKNETKNDAMCRQKKSQFSRNGGALRKYNILNERTLLRWFTSEEKNIRTFYTKGLFMRAPLHGIFS